VSAINGIPASRYPNLFTIFAQPRHPHTNKELEEKILQEIENSNRYRSGRGTGKGEK